MTLIHLLIWTATFGAGFVAFAAANNAWLHRLHPWAALAGGFLTWLILTDGVYARLGIRGTPPPCPNRCPASGYERLCSGGPTPAAFRCAHCGLRMQLDGNGEAVFLGDGGEPLQRKRLVFPRFLGIWLRR